MTSPQPPVHRRKRLIVAAIAVPLLVTGGVGLQALTTLSSSVDDNTSTVHGAHVPKPSMEVTGDPFAIAFNADATVTGSTPTPFVITNHGDAAGTWEAFMSAAADADPEVAAVTEILATVHLHTPRWNTNNPNYRSVNWEFSLGTLAEPLRLVDVVNEFTRRSQMIQADQGTVNAQSLVLTGASLEPGASVTVTVRPRYDLVAAKALADSMAEGETRVASSDFEITYLAS